MRSASEAMQSVLNGGLILATLDLMNGNGAIESSGEVVPSPLRGKSIIVVIPTCHRNDALSLCLEALAPGRQTLDFNAYEVVVSDDGSRSTAEAMIRERYPWAKWTAGPRKGPAANRNSGVRSNRNQWIVFTDDDCVPDPWWIAAYAAAITPDVELYEGRTTCRAGLRGFSQDAPINLNGGTFPSCNLMISRRLFEEIGGFDEKFPPYAIMEDIDFRTRIFAKDRPWKFVPDAVVDHPPRPRVVGRRAGAQWENTVYYWSKRPGHRPYGDDLPLFVAKVRLAEMWKMHRVRDYPQALLSLSGEWWHVLRNYRQWQQRHDARFVEGSASIRSAEALANGTECAT